MIFPRSRPKNNNNNIKILLLRSLPISERPLTRDALEKQLIQILLLVNFCFIFSVGQLYYSSCLERKKTDNNILLKKITGKNQKNDTQNKNVSARYARVFLS